MLPERVLSRNPELRNPVLFRSPVLHQIQVNRYQARYELGAVAGAQLSSPILQAFRSSGGRI